MAVFRIGQISDLHFSEKPGRLNSIPASFESQGWPGGLFEAVRDVARGNDPFYPSSFSPDVALGLTDLLAEEFIDLDALLVTGDVATTGLDADLAIARNYFFGRIPPDWNPVGPRVPLANPQSLIGMGPRIFTMPGNHDRYEGAISAPRSNAFERHFDLDWAFGLGGAEIVPGVESPVRVVRLYKPEEESCLVIGFADFTLRDFSDGRGAWGYIGQGQAYRDIVHDLVRSTRVAASAAQRAGLDTASVWAIHYPPEFPNIDPKLKLLDSEFLCEQALQCGVGNIFSGHTHILARYTVPPPSPLPASAGLTIHCCGASTGISEHDNFTFSDYELTVQDSVVQSVRTWNYRWNKSRGHFDSIP